MLLMSLVVAWVIVRFGGYLAVFQQDAWFWRWSDWVDDSVKSLWGSFAAFVVVLMMPVFIVVLLLRLLDSNFLAPVELLFSVLIFYYSTARGDFDAFSSSFKSALYRADDESIKTLGRDVGDRTDSQATVFQCYQYLRRHSAYWSYSRWLGVAFWFLLLGPAGALFYRCVGLLAVRNTDAVRDDYDKTMECDDVAQHNCAIDLANWLDWLPARVWAFCYVLTGDFSRAFEAFRKNCFGKTEAADLLDNVSIAAITDLQSDEQLEETWSYDHASQQFDELLALNDRSMIVALILFVLLIVIF